MRKIVEGDEELNELITRQLRSKVEVLVNRDFKGYIRDTINPLRTTSGIRDYHHKLVTERLAEEIESVLSKIDLESYMRSLMESESFHKLVAEELVKYHQSVD